MTMTSKERLELLRKTYTEQEEAKNKSQSKTSNAGLVYQHWDIPDNSEAVVRFLPDGNPNNPDFCVTQMTINLPFAGQIGGEFPTDEPVTVTVPCMEQFKKPCPIIIATRPWWKKDDMLELARMYYKKVSYIYQGFVVKSPMVEENSPENPIRRFKISKSIYEIIYKGVMNPEFEDFPVDYIGGRDFKIAKSKKGGVDAYANYATSSWSFKSRSLSENELIAIEQFGLPNLSDVLGKEPDEDGVEMIKHMFNDSKEGKPFDFDSYGHLYRAYGSRQNQNTVNTTVSVPSKSVRPAPKVDVAERDVAVSNEGTTSKADQVADILARIRAKTSA